VGTELMPTMGTAIAGIAKGRTRGERQSHQINFTRLEPELHGGIWAPALPVRSLTAPPMSYSGRACATTLPPIWLHSQSPNPPIPDCNRDHVVCWQVVGRAGGCGQVGCQASLQSNIVKRQKHGVSMLVTARLKQLST